MDYAVYFFRAIAFTLPVLVSVAIIYIVVLYCIDVRQTNHAIRRNYPVIGRLRYLFEKIGVFFRQYFFSLDREELPFNRAERSWVYRAAKNIDNTLAFGSTREMHYPGSVFFSNAPYAILEEEKQPTPSIVFGEQIPHPYATNRLFHVSGMSYGAISKPAILALTGGARLAGCWTNTGEGGLSRWHLEGGSDIVFQIGTAKNGIQDENGKLSEQKLIAIAEHPQVKMFEIKLSQGAKPGKGGMLPGDKVTEEIAKARGIKTGQDAFSPNRHPEITSDSDLLDFIEKIRKITGKPVGCKFVLGDPQWIDQLCRMIQKRGTSSAPDFIAVDGAEGGSGAAPMSLMDNVGLPLADSLPTVINALSRYGLRERIRVIASGKLITACDVAWALCIGADSVVTARGFMFALGCIQALQCNKNTCPTGITTHDTKLQRGLNVASKMQRVANYAQNIERELALIAHSCGLSQPRAFRRQHARVIQQNKQSSSLLELYPLPQPD